MVIVRRIVHGKLHRSAVVPRTGGVIQWNRCGIGRETAIENVEEIH